MLDFGKGKLKQWSVEDIKTLKQKQSVLSKRLASMKAEHIDDISFLTTQHSLMRQLGTIDQSLQRFQFDQVCKTWTQHAKQLQPITNQQSQQHNVGRMVIANRLLHRETEIFYNDQNVCQRCNCLYVFDHITNVNICSSCGSVFRVLFVLEDQSQDLLVGKDPISTQNKNYEKSQQVSIYHRSPLYRRFLQQFSVNAPQIPLDIMSTLYQYLSNIHLQNSVRCRPTPVATILRANGFSKWASSAITISKMFNGEPVPRLSDVLIERLVHRFIIIFQVVNVHTEKKKQKIPSFEFLTHILLFLENEPRLARSFKTHKTRDILLKTYTQFLELLESVKSSPLNDCDWTNLPVF